MVVRRVVYQKFLVVILCLVTVFIISGLFATIANPAQAQSEITQSSRLLQDSTDDGQIIPGRIDVNFNLISPGSGWVQEGDELFWTTNNGGSWDEITPPIDIHHNLVTVYFLDNLRGWIVISTEADNTLQYELASTKDGGAHWNIEPFDYLTSQEKTLLSNEIYMQWIDGSSGWVLFKEATSSNFSQGLMFATNDGGYQWERLIAPIGEPFIFIDESVGYMAGGPGGELLYQSNDAGRSWQGIGPLISPTSDIHQRFSLPVFTAAGYGLLAMQQTQDGMDNRLTLYETIDWGLSWSIRERIGLNHSIDNQLSPYITLIDHNNFQVWIPNGKQIIGIRDGNELDIQIANDDYQVTKLSMSGDQSGWGKFVNNTCITEVDETVRIVNCVNSTRLAYTENGGGTWETLDIPSGKGEFNYEWQYEVDLITNSINTPTTNTVAYVGQGFDKCEIPTPSQMQTWFTSSPYKTVNLYIGGISRACSNVALTADYVSQLFQQGWKFFPTWVGPQAPCSGFNNRMSYDPVVAYQQGVDNASQAVAKLLNLGLTLNDGTGSVVYYDIEAYSGDDACYAAVNAFMNGWSYRLNELGNLSGIYGSSCGSHLTNYFSLLNPPDVIWPAAWYHSSGLGYYNPSATVWDVPCISNTVYANHQRIRQYEGGHTETWGGVSLVIDSNVLDGVVAIPNSADRIPPVSTVSLSGTAGENGWYKSSVVATITATDDSSGVSYTQYNLEGAGWVTYTAPVSINTDGSHILQYRSVDNAGNWEAAKSAAVKIDTVAPQGSIEIMDGWEATYQTAVRMNTPAGDNTSGVALYQLRDAGGTWTGWLPHSMTSSWLLPAQTGQTYAVEAQYKDYAGNVSPIYSDSIYLDIYPEHPASQNYQLSKSTFGMSATNAQSASFQLTGTLAQVSAAGYSESNQYQVTSGFWSWISDLVEFFNNFLPLITK